MDNDYYDGGDKYEAYDPPDRDDYAAEYDAEPYVPEPADDYWCN